MQGPGIGVTPEFLSEAAAAIAEALDIVDVPSVPDSRVADVDGVGGVGGVDGTAYGHAGLGAAVAEFGEAVRLASGLLVEAADGAVTGLRADARAYAARERATLSTLLGAGGGVSASAADGR